MLQPLTFRREQLHPSVFLARGAVVLGDVTIDADSSVWFAAVLRGDAEAIRIGARTNIQDGCVLHADPGFPCTIGNGVTVGHGAIVHGATIGDNVMLGMRSVVMNGACVGENCVIGVGAVVTEGKQIPPGSLVVGLPGRIVRQLAPEEIAFHALAAEHYVAAAAAHRAAGNGAV